MQIQNIKIEELKAAEYNPRRASDKEYQDLKKSIEKFGFVEPIIVNENADRMNVIVGGHFRVKVARDLGMTEVPCVYIDLNEETERELNLRLNKNVGEWDFDMLLNLPKVLLNEVGFTANDLKLNVDKIELPKDNPQLPEKITCPECGFSGSKDQFKTE